jgi:hypothetical protein
MRKPKIKALTIIGRRWFDRTYGNTYHTAEIIINGETIHKTPMEYGYESQYVTTATKWLTDNKYLKLPEYTPIWSYCSDKGIAYTAIPIDGLKREL